MQISAERLRIRSVDSTLVACSDVLHAEDEWLAAFSANPRWRLDEDQQTLTSGEMVIELEAQRG